MGSKLMTAAEAVEKYVNNGDTVAISGFQTSALAQETIEALASRFDETGEPRDLTVIAGTTPGLDMFAKEGMVKRVIAGSYLFSPEMAKMATSGKVEAYNFPSGVIAHLFRETTNKNGGLLTTVGENTFVDPRICGGKMNSNTTEDLVTMKTVLGQSYLYYKAPKIDVAIIRCTTCDENGNAVFNDEPSYSFAVAAAFAAKSSGGKVICECRDYVMKDSLSAKDVKLVHLFVDAIVKIDDSAKYYKISEKSNYNKVVLGKAKLALNPAETMEASPIKAIAKRAAMEIEPNSTVSIGAGIAKHVSDIVAEEGAEELVCMASESGANGGVMQYGEPFGIMANHMSLLDEPNEYDFFHSGILDAAFMSFMQVDSKGAINSSMLGNVVAGCGPAMDEAYGASKLVFCGKFARDAKERVEDGKLVIESAGDLQAFVEAVDQITIDGGYEIKQGKKIVVITERAVFELTDDGLVLTEVAPGVDEHADVLDLIPFIVKVSDSLKIMDSRLFSDETIDLKAKLA